jgi:hypothetical protein
MPLGSNRLGGDHMYVYNLFKISLAIPAQSLGGLAHLKRTLLTSNAHHGPHLLYKLAISPGARV